MNLSSLKLFLLAGNAQFTLVSKKTGKRFRFSIKRCPRNKSTTNIPPWFVSYFDSKGKRYFMGTIKFAGRNYIHSRKCRLGRHCEVVKSIEWLWKHVLHTEHLESRMDIDHGNRCGKCQRKLTDKNSIDRGLGPVCYKTLTKLGGVK